MNARTRVCNSFNPTCFLNHLRAFMRQQKARQYSCSSRLKNYSGLQVNGVSRKIKQTQELLRAPKWIEFHKRSSARLWSLDKYKPYYISKGFQNYKYDAILGPKKLKKEGILHLPCNTSSTRSMTTHWLWLRLHQGLFPAHRSASPYTNSLKISHHKAQQLHKQNKAARGSDFHDMQQAKVASGCNLLCVVSKQRTWLVGPLSSDVITIAAETEERSVWFLF